MTRTLVQDVVRVSTSVLVAVIVLIGIVTAGLLHMDRVLAGDAALLAAGQAWGTRDWEVEHAHSPVEVRFAVPGDPLLPADWNGASEDEEKPRFWTSGDRRVLLLTVEHGKEGEERHTALLVTGPRTGAASSMGPFLMTYAVVAGLATAAGSWALRRLLGRATAPLAAARDSVSRAVGAGANARVAVGGPAEVAELLGAVNGLLARLDDAFHAQSRFTAEAAHELRTPVTVLLGEIDVALRRPRSAEEYAAILASSREEVLRLGALVEGLLQLARVDAGQAEQGREPVELRTLVEQAARGSARVELAAVPDGMVIGNGALLVSAVANLVRNAVRYAPGSPVRVSVEREGGMAHIRVDDRGPGIPAAEREAVFDRLSRGSRARRSHAGLGLGLPLAREIARRHGGDCRVEDAPGGGCRVVLTLPVLAEVDARAEAG